MADLATLTARNAARWLAAKITRGSEFKSVAKRLVAAKDRYQAVATTTGVPWFVIAVTHERESSQSWSKSLAQGDPWNRVSTHVPKGRGPFESWEAAAIDALVVCPPYASKWKDWSAGGTMCLLEQYNGLGYAKRGQPSPYVWSGTDQYQRGKYVADGVYDPNVVDSQLGCAGLILAMQAIDPSISFDGAPAKPAQKPAQPIPPPPDIEPTTTPVKPLKKSKTIWGGIVGWLTGVGSTISGFFEHLDNPYTLTAFLAIIVALSVAAYLVIKGRIDVNKIVKSLSGDE